MLPIETIDRLRAEDGTEFSLRKRGDEWMVQVNERILMSSRVHHSEEELATRSLERVPGAERVFIGGLGLGYTLRAALDALGSEARVQVVELLPELVEWNRTYLGELTNHPLSDARCEVVVGDAFDELRKSKDKFDAILMDIDNGPIAMSNGRNQRLYSERGLRQCLGYLKPTGLLAIWSAGPSPSFEARLVKVGGTADVLRVDARKGGHAKHFIFTVMPKVPVPAAGV